MVAHWGTVGWVLCERSGGVSEDAWCLIHGQSVHLPEAAPSLMRAVVRWSEALPATCMSSGEAEISMAHVDLPVIFGVLFAYATACVREEPV